jgi:hypothetical protein
MVRPQAPTILVEAWPSARSFEKVVDTSAATEAI